MSDKMSDQLRERIAELEAELADVMAAAATGALRIKELEECIKELEEQEQEYEEMLRTTMDEKCTANEKHCTCVPILRRRVRQSEIVMDALAKDLSRRWYWVSLAGAWCDRAGGHLLVRAGGHLVDTRCK